MREVQCAVCGVWCVVCGVPCVAFMQGDEGLAVVLDELLMAAPLPGRVASESNDAFALGTFPFFPFLLSCTGGGGGRRGRRHNPFAVFAPYLQDPLGSQPVPGTFSVPSYSWQAGCTS